MGCHMQYHCSFQYQVVSKDSANSSNCKQQKVQCLEILGVEENLETKIINKKGYHMYYHQPNGTPVKTNQSAHTANNHIRQKTMPPHLMCENQTRHMTHLLLQIPLCDDCGGQKRNVRGLLNSIFLNRSNLPLWNSPQAIFVRSQVIIISL